MLDKLLERGAILLQWDLRVTTVLIFFSILILTRSITTIKSYGPFSKKGDTKSPRVVPYEIPGVGNMLPLLFDTCGFYSKIM
jgi:hypothetical protein